MTPAHRPVARISPVVGTNVFAEGNIFSGGVLTSLEAMVRDLSHTVFTLLVTNWILVNEDIIKE